MQFIVHVSLRIDEMEFSLTRAFETLYSVAAHILEQALYLSHTTVQSLGRTVNQVKIVLSTSTVFSIIKSNDLRLL